MMVNKRKTMDRMMYFLSAACVAVAIVPLLSILYTVTVNGISSINLDFLTQLPEPVGEPGGGLGNAIEGTFIVLGVAAVIGLPIGILAGIYLSEYGEKPIIRFDYVPAGGNSHRLWINEKGSATRFVADVLTGIPSIVVGIFVYSIIVLYFGSFSAFAGGIALSVLMIPLVARTTEESLKLVPDSIREASLALGIPKWRTTISIVLSTARSGIITGVLLSIARVSGETAPLLFTSFGNMFWFNGLDKPVSTLPVQIYTYAITPFPDWHAKAWGGAFILIIMVLILNIGVRFITRRRY